MALFSGPLLPCGPPLQHLVALRKQLPLQALQTLQRAVPELWRLVLHKWFSADLGDVSLLVQLEAAAEADALCGGSPELAVWLISRRGLTEWRGWTSLWRAAVMLSVLVGELPFGTVLVRSARPAFLLAARRALQVFVGCL